jgi:hypothetical protein
MRLLHSASTGGVGKKNAGLKLTSDIRKKAWLKFE